MISEALLLISSGLLGIFLGAQIAEAMLLVPYWKALSPEHFFELHRTYGKKIHQFFAPITIAATILPLITVANSLISDAKDQLLLVTMGVSTLLFFSSYFLYFKKANRSFFNRSISDEALPSALKKWGVWHWGRIVFEFIAFSCSLILLMNA
ncbi:MAG: hypothetical protein AAF363_00065 [Bacteroidota bacterium]